MVKGIGGILKLAWNSLRRKRTARNSEAFLEGVRESGRRVHPESANPVRKPEENVAAAATPPQTSDDRLRAAELRQRGGGPALQSQE